MDLRSYYDDHWTHVPEGDVDYSRLRLVLDDVAPGSRVLDSGCGPGFLAALLAEHGVDVVGTDVSRVGPERTRARGIDAQQVDLDTDPLPFADGAFDVVISNHVIEHVGLADDQRRHLSELRRVMATRGVGYLAVPNRWMLVEPHYHLAFLSWLPRRWRSRYLALRGKGKFYDCEPLTLGEIEGMLADTGFAYENLGVPAIRATLDIEGAHGFLRSLLRAIPDRVLAGFASVVPTLIYRIRGDR